MALKVILFDMDGVLVFSEPLHFIAWSCLYQSINGQCPSFFKQEAYSGVSDDFIAFELVRKLGLTDLPETLLAKKQRIFLHMLNFSELETPLGRNRFLEECRDRYQIALVSSSSKREVEAILRREKLGGIFNAVITGDDVSSHKPSPEPYLLVLEKLGIAPEEAVAIEDSASGIAAAEGAGIRVIPFNGSFEDILTDYP